jgi:hypothetical protein
MSELARQKNGSQKSGNTRKERESKEEIRVKANIFKDEVGIEVGIQVKVETVVASEGEI